MNAKSTNKQTQKSQKKIPKQRNIFKKRQIQQTSPKTNSTHLMQFYGTIFT